LNRAILHPWVSRPHAPDARDKVVPEVAPQARLDETLMQRAARKVAEQFQAEVMHAG
jgi:hypothetical protein